MYVDWQSSPLPNVTPARRSHVAHFHSRGGHSTCAPPDFNDSMLAMWEELWNAMPQTGRVNLTMKYLIMTLKGLN